MAFRSMKDTLPDTVFSARWSDPKTSREAAARVQPHITAIQTTVLGHVKAAGLNGLTDYELQVAMDDHGSTARSRRAELVKLKLVKDSGLKRKHEGTNRTVWIAA